MFFLLSVLFGYPVRFSGVAYISYCYLGLPIRYLHLFHSPTDIPFTISLTFNTSFSLLCNIHSSLSFLPPFCNIPTSTSHSISGSKNWRRNSIDIHQKILPFLPLSLDGDIHSYRCLGNTRRDTWLLTSLNSIVDNAIELCPYYFSVTELYPQCHWTPPILLYMLLVHAISIGKVTEPRQEHHWIPAIALSVLTEGNLEHCHTQWHHHWIPNTPLALSLNITHGLSKALHPSPSPPQHPPSPWPNIADVTESHQHHCQYHWLISSPMPTGFPFFSERS